MQVLKQFGWIFYVADNAQFDENKVGKWMYFFNDADYVAHLCEKAVRDGIVKESKHSNAPKGVACFYLHGDDLEAHKRVIGYFMDNDLIEKTKTGRLHNISFKYDRQTRAGEYGDSFHSDIRLEQFVDLNTGEFLQ